MMIPEPIQAFASRLQACMQAPPVHGTPPLSPDETANDHWINKAALELYELQRRFNPAYNQFCRSQKVRAVSHWREIPPIPAVAFKRQKLTCLAARDLTHVFYSSGTTTQERSSHFHSEPSLRLYEASSWAWFTAHVGTFMDNCVPFCLTPSPAEASHSSLVHMMQHIATRHNGPRAVFFGNIESSTGLWTLRVDALVKELSRAESENLPVALLGAAFHFVNLVDHLRSSRERLNLPNRSWIFETGGYKGRSRSLARADFHALLREQLGIPLNRIVGEYGMCELSSQAYDHHLAQEESPIATGERIFRFPPWTRVRVLSPETRQEVDSGETGLISVLDLANAWSVLAVQTEDLGHRVGSGFIPIGRMSGTEPRGCSLQIA